MNKKAYEKLVRKIQNKSTAEKNKIVKREVKKEIRIKDHDRKAYLFRKLSEWIYWANNNRKWNELEY